MQLRPYQQDAIAAVERDWDGGERAVLGTAATGAGKTNTFLALINRRLEREPGARAMILSHREELVQQPVDRLWQFFPKLAMRTGVVKAAQDECDKQVISASVQTLAVPGRLERVLEYGPIGYLITDEAHHATAATYRTLFERMEAANPEMRHLGVTATPKRADGEGLREVYAKESFHYGIKELVKTGYLVPPRWLAIQTAISLAGVPKSSSGDFNGKQLANVFETENCFDLVVETHKKYMDGRQCLAFVESVDGAYRLAERFSEAGIVAAAADGTTAKGERAGLLDQFRRGDVQVLVNCQLWTEGVDLPMASGLHQVRPTRSDSLYTQMIGRVLRLWAGKPDALILDYAPADSRDIVMMGDVLGVPARRDAYVTEDVSEGEIKGGFTFDQLGLKWYQGNPAEIVTQALNYLDMSAYSWHRAHGWMTLGLGPGEDKIERTLCIAPIEADGTSSLWMTEKNPDTKRTSTRMIYRGDFDTILSHADELTETLACGILSERGKGWRKAPISPGQETFLRNLGVWQPGLSKGEAAELITHTLTVNYVRKALSRGIPSVGSAQMAQGVML